MRSSNNRRLCVAGALFCWLIHAAGAVDPTHRDFVVAEDAGLPTVGFAIETFDTDEGLPQNTINTVLQSRDGYLWMGTYNGLVRFDGVRFTVFDASSTPALLDGRVTSLFEEANGTLWIGHENGEVSRYRDGTLAHQNLGNHWPGASVVGICQDASGEIWILNNLGVMIRASDQKLLMPLAAADDSPSGVPSLIRDAQGRLWMSYRGVAGIVDAAGLIRVAFNDPQGTPYIEELCASQDGGLWVITSTTIRRWRDGLWMTDLGPCPWGSSSVTCAMETRDGQLVVGTLDQGLFIVDPSEKGYHLNRQNGLPHEWVRSLCEDHEGNLWVGTSGAGLCVLRKARVVMVDPPDRWLGRTVLSICPGQHGELWVGTEGAGLYCLHEERWTHYGTLEGLSNPFIWSVLTDHAGGVHAGTWGEGLFSLKDGAFTVAPGWEELKVAVTSMLEGADDTLWVGTGRGLLNVDGTNMIWVYGNADTVFPGVRTILESRAGVIWFGTAGQGLGRLENGVIRMFTVEEGLASDYILDISMDGDDTLWIGTQDNGLCRFRQGAMRTINQHSGLANNVIGAVADDGLGYLWLSSQQGILRVSKEELNRYADGNAASVSCLVYGKRQGLATLACSAGFSPSWCRTAEGRLVFPTAQGLAVVDPRQVEPNQHAPFVRIEDVRVEGRSSILMDHASDPAGPKTAERQRPAPQEAGLVMKPGERRLDIYYTALSYVDPDSVRFRHKLDPLEKQWVDGGTRRSVNYSFVPPGNYTFQVIACNNDGVWNETGAQLAVRVLPQFWETWPFRIAMGILAMAAVTGLVLVDARRRLHRKLERLESERAVERERTRIAQDIHDDLGASLTRILMLTQDGSVDAESGESVEDNIRQVHRTARELTREMDEIVWAVNPEHDTLESLVNYLCRYSQTYLNAAHLRCRLDVPVELPGWSVRAEVRHNLFLAFKEILNNIVKHADATEVRVVISLTPTEFRLELRDNGRGLGTHLAAESNVEPEDSDRIASGLGLENIRRRLTGLDGNFEITGGPGQGTTFDLRIPLKSMSTRGASRRKG